MLSNGLISRVQAAYKMRLADAWNEMGWHTNADKPAASPNLEVIRPSHVSPVLQKRGDTVPPTQVRPPRKIVAITIIYSVVAEGEGCDAAPPFTTSVFVSVT
jgi:hypothetical protein